MDTLVSTSSQVSGQEVMVVQVDLMDLMAHALADLLVDTLAIREGLAVILLKDGMVLAWVQRVGLLQGDLQVDRQEAPHDPRDMAPQDPKVIVALLVRRCLGTRPIVITDPPTMDPTCRPLVVAQAQAWALHQYPPRASLGALDIPLALGLLGAILEVLGAIMSPLPQHQAQGGQRVVLPLVTQ